MIENTAQVMNLLEEIRRIAVMPFWKSPDFWITQTISLGGLLFSVLAFREAGMAKSAAAEAGRAVKLQSITIELTEVCQKMDRLKTDISFSEAREMLNEISRRLRRAISPFSKDPTLETTISGLKTAIEAAKQALTNVKPSSPDEELKTRYAVYNAVEANFGAINDLVADLLGLFEDKTIKFGDAEENGAGNK